MSLHLRADFASGTQQRFDAWGWRRLKIGASVLRGRWALRQAGLIEVQVASMNMPIRPRCSPATPIASTYRERAGPCYVSPPSLRLNPACWSVPGRSMVHCARRRKGPETVGFVKVTCEGAPPSPLSPLLPHPFCFWCSLSLSHSLSLILSLSLSILACLLSSSISLNLSVSLSLYFFLALSRSLSQREGRERCSLAAKPPGDPSPGLASRTPCPHLHRSPHSLSSPLESTSVTLAAR